MLFVLKVINFYKKQYNFNHIFQFLNKQENQIFLLENFEKKIFFLKRTKHFARKCFLRFLCNIKLPFKFRCADTFTNLNTFSFFV
jgi:hypothetical protein